MPRALNFRLNRTSLTMVFALTAVVAVACTGSSGGGGNFRIDTYQSAGVLEGRETDYQTVLDQGKPVVLNFWGGLCPPCRAEMPVLEDAWQEFRDDVVVLGVDIGPFFRLGEVSDGIALLREMGVTYPAGNSRSSSLMEDFNLNSLPSTFFMLPNGEIVDDWPGAISSGQLRRRINNLIDAHAEQQG